MGFQQIQGGGMMVTGKASISIYRLASMKGAVRLESLGMKSRGGSRTALMRKELGLKARAPHADVIKAIENKIAELREESAKEE